MCNCRKGGQPREVQRLRREPTRVQQPVVERQTPPNRRSGGTTWNGPERRSTGTNGPSE
jgi:hypothetical protein